MSPLRALSLLLCLFASAAHAQTASDLALEPIRLQLKWSHQFQFAGYYAALSRGYYADAGFDVTLIEGRSDRTPNEIVVAGEAEFGVAGSELALAYLEGQPLTALAAIFQHSAYTLVVLESSGLRVPSDLAGRSIMLRNNAMGTEIYAMLARAGLKPGDFEEVHHTYRHEDLLEGKVDAMAGYLTDQPFFPNAPDEKVFLIRPFSFGVDFYGDCLFTTRALLDTRRERVEAFREASLRGWRYAMEHPDEVIAWIQQHYPGRRTEEQLRSEANAMRELILPQLVPLGLMNLSRWEHIADAYREAGTTTNTTSLSDFVFTEQPGIDLMSLRRHGWIIGPLVTLGISWMVFLIYFNRRLARSVRERTTALERTNAELRAESARRDEAELAFHQGEEYYRNLLERLPIGLALSRMTGELVYVNEAYAHTIGRTVEQTLGLTYWDITPEDYREQELNLLDQVAAHGRFDSYEKEYFHADGHRVPVRLNGILLDRDGEAHMWACVEDISTVREAERALRYREEQYRTVFESIPLGLIISNADGSTADVNPAAHLMHGFTREEFLALTPDQFIHRASLPDFKRYIEEVIAGNEFHVSAKDLTRDGGILDVEVFGVPFRHHGKPRLLGILQDVTARVQAEQALHASEEKYRSIVETTKEWIWEIDLAGAHTYCNPTLTQILGYPTEEFLTMDTFSLLHPEDRENVALILPACIEKEEGWEGWVLRWRHRDGSYRFLESNAAPIRDHEGKLSGFRGVDRDISDRIESERLLSESMDALARHQEQLEALVQERSAALEKAQAELIRKERLATLGQLIGTVSHEIRNPLGTIRGSVFSVGQMIRKQEFDRIEPVLERAERNIIRCDRIIEELLDFTRTRRLERQTTPIDPWLGEVLEEIPLGNGIQCVCHLDAGGTVSIDREHLRRAIVNLVNNAVQSMEQGEGVGNILRISTERSGNNVVIAITDEGVGIPKELMEKIFEPLFSTRGFGVGLGIPIIKDIIDAHEGRLNYESVAGQGTTVKVWLPTV